MKGLQLDLDLAATLQMVADTVTVSLGFSVAAMNLVEGDHLVCIAVSGSASARDLLLGMKQQISDWERLLEASRPLGRLRFLDHRAIRPEAVGSMVRWVPDIPASDDPDAWHPDDALFAPLVSSTGESLGMLSVDLPRDGRRPGLDACRALEAFGVTASLAIEHASLAEHALQGHRRFEAVFESSPIAMSLVDAKQRYASVNAAYCRFLRRSADELLGRDPHDFNHPADVEASRRLASRVREGSPGPHILEKRFVLPDGEIVWGRLHMAALHDDTGGGLVVSQIEDITDRKRVEGRLRRQAQQDALTGLPNRSETLRRLQEALESDRRSGKLTAVFFCDLDRLKWLNDTQGHAVGDAYLREVGHRLAGAVRSRDTVGRLGGDEFVVILPSVVSEEEAAAIAGRLIEAVRRPWRSGPDRFTPSVSLGISFATAGRPGADELLSRADTAMYRAKIYERGSWHIYDEVHDPVGRGPAPTHFALRGDLATAVEHKQFELHYQPIVALADNSVVGYEALLRWVHPRMGLLVPAQFLDVVLDSEYESPVTDWALQEACRKAAAHPGRDEIVSVNVSSVQVSRRDLPEVVERALIESGLPASRLSLELTEDRLLSRPDGAARLEELRAIGVEIALDDFGSGYSGLHYLHRFPAITAIKLDGAFVAGLHSNTTSEKIIRSTVALASDCGLALVAEGVETAEQARMLAGLAVPCAQGYLFGAPGPAWSQYEPPSTEELAAPTG